MKDMLIVMAILGCGDGDAECQMIQKVNTGFASIAACKAASPAVLERLTDLGYPVIMAQCRQQVRPPAVAQQVQIKPTS